MRLISWLLGLPLAAVATVFAVANRQEIHFDLWPLPFGLDIAAYLAILGPLALGLLAGAALVWLSGTPARLRACQDRRRVESLERQLAAAEKPTP
jgi:putative membrane protein